MQRLRLIFLRWLRVMNKTTFPPRLAVTYRPVGDLIPDPRNARTHPKRQIDQIRASIEAFGFTNPILAGTSPMREWDRFIGQSTNWFLSTGLGGRPIST